MTDVSFNMGQMNDCPCTIQLAQFHKQFLPSCPVTTKNMSTMFLFEWHALAVRESVFLAQSTPPGKLKKSDCSINDRCSRCSHAGKYTNFFWDHMGKRLSHHYVQLNNSHTLMTFQGFGHCSTKFPARFPSHGNFWVPPNATPPGKCGLIKVFFVTSSRSKAFLGTYFLGICGIWGDTLNSNDRYFQQSYPKPSTTWMFQEVRTHG